MPDKPELIWEPGAVDDLSRLREFIQPHNPKVAAKAARRIIESANQSTIGQSLSWAPHRKYASI